MNAMTQKFEPVFVRVSAVNYQVVTDAVRATGLLLKHWPQEFVESDLNRAALAACLAAWEADGDPMDARAAFVQAAHEAGILAPEDD
ncbi:DUF982 domain-containing protein [Kaistia terrae]